MASKAFSKSLLSSYRSLRRRLVNPLSIYLSRDQQKPRKNTLSSLNLCDNTLILDVEGGLLRSSSLFPYFMVVALEAGCILRGLVLLLLYPLLCCLTREAGIRVMVFLCFSGIKEKEFRVGKAVLPKHLLEDVGLEAFEVLRRARKKVCVSSLPRVMVEEFLKEYLEVQEVAGRELKVIRGYYTGFMEKERSEKVLFGEEEVEEEQEVDDGVVGIASCTKSPQHQLFSLCKVVYRVTEAEKRSWHALPRERYPQPLIFHDGRMAFRPTPSAAAAMFLWLPFAILLTIFRSIVFVLLRYDISIPIGAATGMTNRLPSPLDPTQTNSTPGRRGRLFVCNHRTLLDPVYVSAALNKAVVAVTYSVSPLTEALAPIKTARLTRNKDEDQRRMERLLSEGDLVVCPEGTTCREPYLLRFSPLFAEIADEIFPVALSTRVSMFYGTTASGFKWLDHFYFLMNPWPEYECTFLEKIPTSSPCGGGGRYEVANLVQRRIGDALGFQCTMLTRKDKYMMLAGNVGIVNTKN
ncbi:hypothetical protein Cni_G24756 [Canna indica]|uniref:Phospholipid/glycerol acyltransferase domain-containing protein n=1 Tax=Canna indica TaxID=4628 RepID=A0AAQ3QLS0_9LILI|nr:hypothetical protein Cni_G24756 [Canna indica]